MTSVHSSVGSLLPGVDKLQPGVCSHPRMNSVPLFQLLCWALSKMKGTCGCCPGIAWVSTTMSRHISLEGHLHIFWGKCTKVVL